MFIFGELSMFFVNEVISKLATGGSKVIDV